VIKINKKLKRQIFRDVMIAGEEMAEGAGEAASEALFQLVPGRAHPGKKGWIVSFHGMDDLDEV
jgi:hypothetical protein